MLTLVVLSALSISVAAIVELTTSNEKAFGRDQQSNRALYVAEAGLNEGVSNVAVKDFADTRPDGAQPGGNLSGLVPLDGLQATWTAKKTFRSGNVPSKWVVTATATSKTGVTRQLRSVLTAGTPGALTYAVYFSGDYDANGTNAKILNLDPNNRISVYIGGTFDPSGGASIGIPTDKVLSAVIRGGCPDAAHLCSSSTNVYADNCAPTCPTGTTVVTKPVIYPDELYNQVNWANLVGTNCTASGKPRFDPIAAGRSLTLPGNVSSYIIGANYDCTENDVNGNYLGRMSYVSSTKTLTVNGAVFVDGSIDATQDLNIRGTGTMYVNGNVMGGQNKRWSDGGTAMVTLAVVNQGGSPTSVAFDAGNGEYDVSVYAVGGVVISGNGEIHGRITADDGAINGNPAAFVPSTVTTGLPTQWSYGAGAWSQLK